MHGRAEVLPGGSGGVQERRALGVRQDEPCLDEALTRRLGQLGIKAERLFGGPQDLAWAARDGQVFSRQTFWRLIKLSGWLLPGLIRQQRVLERCVGLA